MNYRKKNYTTTKREREREREKLQIYNMEHSYN